MRDQIIEAMTKKLWRDVYSKRCHAEITAPPEEAEKLAYRIADAIETVFERRAS